MKIYARGNEKCTVIHLFSTIFENPLDTDILVEEGNKDCHAHVHLKYKLTDDKGFYNYKLVDGKLVLRSDKEKESEQPIEQLKQSKCAEISKACEQTIFNGIDIGNEHFSLTYNDQINLSALFEMIKQGAETALYHADGELCRPFTADEIVNLMTKATEFKTYNTTYCNHLFNWINRCETVEKVNAIFYGAELPTDLQNHMNEVLGIETTD